MIYYIGYIIQVLRHALVNNEATWTQCDSELI